MNDIYTIYARNRYARSAMRIAQISGEERAKEIYAFLTTKFQGCIDISATNIGTYIYEMDMEEVKKASSKYPELKNFVNSNSSELELTDFCMTVMKIKN